VDEERISWSWSSSKEDSSNSDSFSSSKGVVSSSSLSAVESVPNENQRRFAEE